MASLSTSSVKLLLLLFALLQSLPTHSFEFEVGGDDGWVVPPAKNTQIYNQWASKNRFQIGDIISFKYKKDSVMVVTEEEYEKCRSSHPIFFANNGETEYKLQQPGLYYFISGVAGHCERGQKMVIKVMSHAEAPGGSPAGGNQTGTPAPPGSSGSSGAVPPPARALGLALALLIGSLLLS